MHAYQSYPPQTDLQLSGHFRWAGDANRFTGGANYIELVCSPNNPDGAVRAKLIRRRQGQGRPRPGVLLAAVHCHHQARRARRHALRPVQDHRPRRHQDRVRTKDADRLRVTPVAWRSIGAVYVYLTTAGDGFSSSSCRAHAGGRW
jgi:hypothetical protein